MGKANKANRIATSNLNNPTLREKRQSEQMKSLFEGKTITQVTGACQGSTLVLFYLDDGTRVRMTPEYEDYSIVSIEEVVGDIEDLIGTVKQARMACGSLLDAKEGRELWTFYRISTEKGLVTFRWCGASDGYYSVEVKVELDQVPLREVEVFNNGLRLFGKERQEALSYYKSENKLPDECYYFRQENILSPQDINWDLDD